MSKIVFFLAMALFYEDRSGDLTSHWAIANTVLNRIEDHRWPNNIKGVLSQPKQFPWWPTRCICIEKWPRLDRLAWQRALSNARLIYVSRDRVKHKFTCFHAGNPIWAKGLQVVQIPPHQFSNC